MHSPKTMKNLFKISAICLMVVLLIHLEDSSNNSQVVQADHSYSQLEFSVNIQSVSETGGCIDDWTFGCGDADFYPEVSLNAGANVTYSYVDDDNSISPNWYFPKAGSANHPALMQKRADFVIKLWDRDGGLRGDDDPIDIKPNDGRSLIGHVEWNFDEANPADTFTWAKLVVDGAGDGGADFETLFEPNPPHGFVIEDIQFSGNSGDRARVTLDFMLEVSGGIPVDEPGGKVRPLGIHTPIHPSPTDDLTITAGLVDEYGDAVTFDTLEIWIDEDGLEITKDDRSILQGSPGGTCWISGSSSGSTCSETVDLSGIPEAPGLGPDVQRTFSYGIYAENVATHGAKLWSGWRTLTVGNRTGANYIGFSLGRGNPRNAVDLLFTPHAEDYGATGCSNEPVDSELLNPAVYDADNDGLMFPIPSMPVCATPVSQTLFTDGIEDIWTNAFVTSVDWENDINGSVDTPPHLDVITLYQDRFNYWYTTEPGIGTGFSDGDCGVVIPKTIQNGIVLPVASFVDTTFMLHTTPWRDCAPGGGKRVTIEQAEYPTALHEMGHRPFGAADIYCCDGGYHQLGAFPNLYAEQEKFNLWYPGQSYAEGVDQDYDWGDDVPGCEDEPLLGSSGMPVPDANNDPCPSFEDDHSGSSDWFRPEPVESLMGNQWSSVVLADGRTVYVQAGPSTFHRIQWYIGNCDGGGC